jgi:hypothetical protein
LRGGGKFKFHIAFFRAPVSDTAHFR